VTTRTAAAVVVIAALPPAALALMSDHFQGEWLLLASTTAAALAVGALAVQPLLAGRGAVRGHRATGTAIVALVLAHVAFLFILSPDDALFAMSPDGPTRARMALIATTALLVAAFLGALGPRLPLSRTTWRVLHAYLGVLVIVLGIGHAVLTDGALDGAGTPLLLGLGALGLVGIGGAVMRDALRRRRAPSAGAAR
jgi:predicted ferric reductase